MANKSLGTLTLDLIAKVGGFVAGLDKAERESAKFRRQVQQNLSDVGKTLAGLGIAAGVATVALVKSSISTMAALHDQSQAYGIAVEDLSSYAHGAELADVSSKQLAVGFRKLADGIESDADVFKKLGISTRDGKGELRSLSAVLEDVADRFANMPDGIAKTAAANDLLGKSGAQMIPWLNGGKQALVDIREEAERFGTVVDSDAAAAADAFEDNLVKMKAVIRGAGNELAISLLPELVEFTDTINDPETQAGLQALVKGMASFVIEAAKLAALIPNLTRFIAESLAANAGGAAIGDLPRLEDQLKGINEEIAQIEAQGWGFKGRYAELMEQRAATEELIRLTHELQDASTGAPTPPPTGGDNAPAGGGGNVLSDEELSRQQELKKLFDDRLAQYRQQATLGADASELSRVQYEMEFGALKDLTAAQKEQLELWAHAVSTQPLEALIEGQRDAGKQMEQDLIKQIALIGDTTEASRLRYELEQEAFAYLDPAQKLRIVMLAEELDAQRAIIEEEKKANEEREKQGKALQELGLEAARNVQSHFADFLFDPFDDGLKGMLKNFVTTIRRMAAEAASSAILKKVFGAMSTSTNPYLSAIGTAFAGAKDGGGFIGAGQWGIVGEIGPEIVRGPAMVTSRQQTAAMLGGGVEVNIINNAGANVRQGPTRFDGGRRTIDIIIDAVREGGRNGQLDDLFGDFGMSRARGAN
jgi:hypothetical protein